MTLADAAALDLLEGRCDEAVASLEEARQRRPAAAPLLSDLAAAYLARHAVRRQPADLFQALSAAEEALRVDGSYSPARFNRALILHRLLLDREEQAAWTGLLAADRTSPWAAEARTRLARSLEAGAADPWEAQRTVLEQAALNGDSATTRSLTGRFPQQAREYVEEDLLAAWAEATLTRRGAYDRPLRIARAIAAELAHLHGEEMGSDAVAAIDGALRRQGNTDVVELLALGHREYGRGGRLYQRGSFGEAQRAFERARDLLQRAGTPFSGRAEYQLWRCRYQHLEYRAAVKAMHALDRDPRQKHHPALRARARWLAGLSNLVQGRPAESLSEYQAALSAFQELGESNNAAAVHVLIADVLTYLGQAPEAWPHAYQALELTRHAGSALALYRSYLQAAVVAEHLGSPAAALCYQAEVVRACRAYAAPLLKTQALLARAYFERDLGRDQEALGDLAELRGLIDELPDEASRRVVRGDMLLITGQIERRSHPRQALQDLDAALRLYRRTDFHYALAQLLLDRGLTHLSLGNGREAEGDLVAALEERERQRSTIEDERQRISYFDQLQTTCSALILLEVRRGHADRALDYAERGKARALLDWILSLPRQSQSERRLVREPVPRLTARQLAARLPPDVAVVEFASLADRLIVWVLRRQGLTLAQLPLSSSQLRSAVERMHEALQKDPATERVEAATALHGLLIRPIARQLSPGCRLVFIPDGPLAGLPFAALIDPATHRYLVEDHAMVVAPSANIYVQSLARYRSLSSIATAGVLAIGNPAFDRKLFPGLGPLTYAEREMRTVAALVPASRSFSGDHATKIAFLAAAGGFPIVHFAGHALLNEENPLLSGLLFAPAPEDSGVLYARDLLGRRFDRTRLVVLSGCGTSSGRYSKTEGVLSLARVFMAAGVPAVVASSWKIDDERTSGFMEVFYRAMAAGKDPLAALQAAQVASIQDTEHAGSGPENWASFQLMGGIP